MTQWQNDVEILTAEISRLVEELGSIYAEKALRVEAAEKEVVRLNERQSWTAPITDVYDPSGNKWKDLFLKVEAERDRYLSSITTEVEHARACRDDKYYIITKQYLDRIHINLGQLIREVKDEL